ncbi:MAG: hypothetical protein HOI89_08245 [Phycisphaerae bacterium]|nr:hypothetical protein [Phycisphaerae bacterium]MDG2477386.1 hypothetical protein [Phycisphaerales bacterium]
MTHFVHRRSDAWMHLASGTATDGIACTEASDPPTGTRRIGRLPVYSRAKDGSPKAAARTTRHG